jgi:predicted regulator of Ras-like GTPase activity (Roadblock/LC7/MglB family)
VTTAQDLNWMITAFTERVPSVAHAAVVSSDGLPVAFSQDIAIDQVDQLAAVTSGLTSLVQGAARIFDGGSVAQTLVTMEHGLLILMSVSDGSALAVLAAADCDLGLVAYEMALLAEQAGRALTPKVRTPPASRDQRWGS